jgi:hypothetical protein
MKYSIIICLFMSTVLFGQKIEVNLDSLSTLDEEGTFHFELLSDTPKEKLIRKDCIGRVSLKSQVRKYRTVYSDAFHRNLDLCGWRWVTGVAAITRLKT